MRLRILQRLSMGHQVRLIIALALLANLLLVLAGAYVFDTYESYRQDFSERDIPLVDRVAEANRRLASLQLDLATVIKLAHSGKVAEQVIYRQGRELIDQLDAVMQGVAALRSASSAARWLDTREFERRIESYREAVVTGIEMLTVDPARAGIASQLAARVALEVNEEAFALVEQANRHMRDEALGLRRFMVGLLAPIGLALLLPIALAFWLMHRLSGDMTRTFGAIRETLRRLRKGRIDSPIEPVAPTPEARDMALSLETLRRSMEELDDLRSGLEWQVQERTQQLRDANHVLAFNVERLLRTETDLRLYKKAYDSAADAFVITDLQGVIVDVNPAYEQMAGYGRAEILGRKPGFIRSGRHDTAFYRAMWRDLEQKGSWSGEIWNRRRGGELFPAWQAISTIHDDQHRPSHYLAVMRDIAPMKEAARQLEQMAYFDRLTGLANRRLLMDRLDHAIKLARRNGSYGMLLFIDLDHFKHVNDTYGHHAGDELLGQAAQRIQGCVRAADTVGRLAGDEFVVLMEGLSQDATQALLLGQQLGDNIMQALSAEYRLAEGTVYCSASAGISLFGHDQGAGVEELLSRADTAMYEAKKAGRAALAIFDPAMWARLRQRVDMENRLRAALREDRFFILLQPVVDGAGRILGAEALLRWDDGERGIVLPGEFIRLAEEAHLIDQLGNRVLQMVCEQLDRWKSQPGLRGLSIAMNVSGQHFERSDFVPTVAAALIGHAIDPALLKLELTESVVVRDVSASVARMQALQGLGVRLAMDDFGTGYSSLAYLRDLPFDQIKIDRSFIRRVEHEPSDRFIVQSVLAMARLLNLEVVAEGVETTAQLDALAALGCERFQGYLFSRPVSLEEFERLVAQQTVDLEAAP